jgi:hypothetical protein
MLRAPWLLSLSLTSSLLAGCAAEPEGDIEDGEHDTATGKADSPFAEGSETAKQILALVNDPGISDYDLDEEAALSARVAKAIVAQRDGADREPVTADDNLFDTLAELDALPYVGPATMTALRDYARKISSKATLRIDLVAQEWVDGPDMWFTVKLDSLNSELAGDGISFGKQLVLGPRDGRKFLQVAADIKVANQKLHREIELEHTWDPSEYVNLCYSGDIKDIQKTVEGLRESMFSIYMGVQAERWGTTKKVHMGNEREWLDGQREENPQSVAAWERFDTSSSAYLMMTDGGQQGDGTEFFAVLIKRCN